MSYCEPAGVSDFSFTIALDYRHAIAASAMAHRPVAAAIITDRATGRIISIVRDWDGVLDREGVFPRVLGSRVDVAIHRSLPLAN